MSPIFPSLFIPIHSIVLLFFPFHLISNSIPPFHPFLFLFFSPLIKLSWMDELSIQVCTSWTPAQNYPSSSLCQRQSLLLTHSLYPSIPIPLSQRQLLSFSLPPYLKLFAVHYWSVPLRLHFAGGGTDYTRLKSTVNQKRKKIDQSSKTIFRQRQQRTSVTHLLFITLCQLHSPPTLLAHLYFLHAVKLQDQPNSL